MHQINDDDDEEEDKDKVEDNNKNDDDNNKDDTDDKSISAVGLDRDLRFLQGHQGDWPPSTELNNIICAQSISILH